MDSSANISNDSGAFTTPVRRSRGRNFSSAEDVKLCKAWIEVSQNSITGTDQRMETFWGKISDIFNSGKSADDEDYRTPASLQSRWTTLQATVSKFCGTYQAVTNEQHSGWSPEDVLKEALHRYSEKSVRNQAFTSLTCWELLRQYPKWASYTDMLTKKRSTAPARSVDGSSDGAEREESDISLNPTSSPDRAQSTRPEGSKKTQKKMRRKMVTKEDKEEKQKHRQQMLEVTLQKTNLIRDQVAMTLFSLDKDSPESQEFFRLKKLQYLKQLREEVVETV
jgi:hypothetical protein